jgi:uncharacterized protein (TIGR00369 family)
LFFRQSQITIHKSQIPYNPRLSSADKPGNERHVREMFGRSTFIRELGIELTAIGDGWCETTLTPQPEHMQQHGFVHAAVVMALADHTGGGAAGTVLGESNDVITIETKVSFLRPAVGDFLRCRGKVLRAGKNLIFAEAEVFASKDGEEKLVAKAMTTLQVITNEISR